jgi:ankyrin repeat protein
MQLVRIIDMDHLVKLIDLVLRKNNIEICKIFLSGIDHSTTSNYALKQAAETGKLELCEFLLSLPNVDPTDGGSYALESACAKGHVEIVKLLLKDPRVDAWVPDNKHVRIAAYHCRHEIVSLLLRESSNVDPSSRDNSALIWAVRNPTNSSTSAQTVKLLLQDCRVDPSDDGNKAIQYAAMYNDEHVVKELLKHSRVDPSVNNNKPMREAIRRKEYGIAKLLLCDKRVDATIYYNHMLLDLLTQDNACFTKDVLEKLYFRKALKEMLLETNKFIDRPACEDKDDEDEESWH